MPDLWTDLLACLELRPSSAATREGDPHARGADRHSTLATFEGPNQQLEYHRLFGGQLLAQFLRAADIACPDKAVKSMHVLFAREGKSDAPVRYVVQIQHRGRSFATLTIIARQKGEVVATATVSMHAAEDGPEHQTAEAVPPILAPEHGVRLDLIPWETRSTGNLDSLDAHAPDYDLWMRTPQVGAEHGQALIAYATDLNLIGTALRPMEGFGQRGNGTAFTSATTSHTIWFHRPFRADDWLLMRHHSPILAHGRCFGRGDVLTADGTLVASFAQEALLRFRP
ncbi:acyl-CoA thioesterase [Nocardia jejuensis]|uniref:acyl-CoA thioesterase n=1 Tax=Nocardia jejuensis TaxID=328049 RepID=UPI00082DF2AB|nr:acyl-CoA thioesterase domain-containing protein [Nocardia jejuensis]